MSVSVFDLVGAGDGERAVLELDVLHRGFHQVGGDLLALGDDLVHRLHHRRCRRPRGCGCRRCPCRTGSSPCRRARPRPGPSARQADRTTSCASVVSWPWPWLCAPVNTVTLPVGCTRMFADLVEARRAHRASPPPPTARCRRPRCRWRRRCRAACPAPPRRCGAPRSRRSRRPSDAHPSVAW